MQLTKINDDFIYFQADEKTAKRLDAHYYKTWSAWRLPNTLGAMRELYQNGLQNDSLIKQGKIRKDQREALLGLKHAAAVPDYGLRPYQNQDLHFLKELKHGAIFSQQRTGKTPLLLKLIEEEKPEHVVICCPASILYQFSKEVTTWTTYQPMLYAGTAKKREKILNAFMGTPQSILLMSPQTLKNDLEKLNVLPPFYFAVDEAHFLRNYKTKQSKALFQLGKKAIKRVVMTGTPTVNSGQDIYGLLRFLYPERFPSYWNFLDRYFQTKENPWGGKEVKGYKRKDELQELLEEISVQRKRADVMEWLPPKQYQTIHLDMEPKQRKAYKNMLDYFQTGNVVTLGILDQLTRLRQICLAPSSLGIDAPSAKENFLLEWLPENDGQVVIFSNFSSFLKEVQKKIPGSALIIGETPPAERNWIVNDFQQGKTKVILANIQAAGTGLTLDRGETVIFLDKHFSPALNEQAEDRIIATTEESNQSASIITLVCTDSIDEKINQMLEEKKSITNIVNNYNSVNAWLSDM